MQTQNPLVPHTPYHITQTTNAPEIRTEAEVVHNVEEGAADKVIHNGLADPEEKSITTLHPKQQTTTHHKLKDDALHQVQGDVTGGAVKRELPTLSKTYSADAVLLSKSFGDMKVSEEPPTSALQDEYYSVAMTHDIDDDPLDLNEDVYVDSFVRGMVVPPERCGEKRRSLDEVSCRDEEGDDDVAVGHGGVRYYRFGRGGILPGYPTQEGMSKLIIDRMVDDQLRLAGGKSFRCLLS
jgi:hypothetical protein